MLHRRINTILLSMLTCLLLMSCNTKDTLTISGKQEAFTITLKANPTTGFQWTVIAYDNNIFELINQQYIAAKGGAIGSGGNVLFKFKLNKHPSYPSSSIIKFKYFVFVKI